MLQTWAHGTKGAWCGSGSGEENLSDDKLTLLIVFLICLADLLQVRALLMGGGGIVVAEDAFNLRTPTNL